MTTRSLIREKIYKLLLEHQTRVIVRIRDRVATAAQFGEEKDKLRVFQEILERDKWSSVGIQTMEEKRTVQMLEYLLDDDEEVK